MMGRPSFEEAAHDLEAFLRSQGASGRVLWLSRDRVTGRGMTRWVFRPEELTSQERTAKRYEDLCATSTSIRLDSIAQIAGYSLVYLEDYGAIALF
jgi:hypothetical protein